MVLARVGRFAPLLPPHRGRWVHWPIIMGLGPHAWNPFAFLSFHHSIKLGSSNVFKMYKVSCVLMNMLCTFYGNHLTMFST